MRGRVVRRATLATALLLASAGCSGVSLGTASSSPSGKAPSASAPTMTPSARPPAPPDATAADLDTIVVPPYCQQPATRLHQGTVPPTGEPRSSTPETSGASSGSTSGSATSGSGSGSGGAGAGGSGGGAANGHGELSMTGPEAPVLADVNGDGAKEIVAQYTCSAGGTAWPAMIVVVKHGGEVIGHVKLGDIARTEHAHVTSWRAQEGGLAVGWVAYDAAGADKRPFENLLVLNGSAVSFAPTERGRALGQSTIVDGAGTTSFATPTGRVACTLDGADATCAVQRPTWKPEGDTPCASVDAVTLYHGRSGYACTAGEPFRGAAVKTAPRWQRQGSDPTIRGPYGDMAGLAFGRTLTTGQVTCTAATTGVTCSDPLSGHGFTVSGDSYRLF